MDNSLYMKDKLLSDGTPAAWTVKEDYPEYKVEKVLGNGAFGFVFKAINLKTKEPVAIKRIVKVGKYISREFEILTQLKGKENCLQLLDFFYTEDGHGRVIQNQIVEFCERGTLEDVVNKAASEDKFLPLDDVRSYVHQIFLGCRQMHELNIVHRDLKLENVLLTASGKVKICDFGASKVIEPGSAQNTPYVVSRYYRAPELILSATKYHASIDVWAVGCMIFQFITGQPLFPGDSEGLQLVEQAAILGFPT